jgi:hypothetical protein
MVAPVSWPWDPLALPWPSPLLSMPLVLAVAREMALVVAVLGCQLPLQGILRPLLLALEEALPTGLLACSFFFHLVSPFPFHGEGDLVERLVHELEFLVAHELDEVWRVFREEVVHVEAEFLPLLPVWPHVNAHVVVVVCHDRSI